MLSDRMVSPDSSVLDIIKSRCFCGHHKLFERRTKYASMGQECTRQEHVINKRPAPDRLFQNVRTEEAK